MQQGPLKIRMLEIFDAVMKVERVTDAAELLGISQPAVSAAIRKLEEDLGVNLFERDGRRLRPTDAAVRLSQSTAPVFNAVSNLRNEVARATRVGLSRLRIYASPSVGHGVALVALDALMDEFPELDVVVTVQDDAQVREAVEMGQADIGLTFGNINEGAWHLLARAHLVVIVPRDHVLTKRATIGPADLQHDRIISAGEVITPLVEAAFNRQGIRYRPKIETRFAQTACAMVQKGLGVAVVDPYVAELFASNLYSIRRFYPATQIAAVALVGPGIHGPRRRIADRFLEILGQEIHHSPIMTHQHRADIYNRSQR
ncbi:hypothetical protein A3753_11785 [Sulfitobacter sp. HI0082]|nr:hypothetical protein A3753_11785 [Sulfitobacter sp. HI0082]